MKKLKMISPKRDEKNKSVDELIGIRSSSIHRYSLEIPYKTFMRLKKEVNLRSTPGNIITMRKLLLEIIDDYLEKSKCTNQ